MTILYKVIAWIIMLATYAFISFFVLNGLGYSFGGESVISLFRLIAAILWGFVNIFILGWAMLTAFGE